MKEIANETIEKNVEIKHKKNLLYLTFHLLEYLRGL